MKGLQLACLLLIGSLFAINGLRQFFVEPLNTPHVNLIWFLIQVLPLLAVLPGTLKNRYRSYVFAALVSTLYFIHGVLLAATADLRAFGVWEAGFAVSLLVAASYAARRTLGAAAP
ncbi:MAG: DUF2069 domain-containing protein [Pseudomonadales bacterium]|nr:DUF2069 domain-containing protein [Pseudomonadales bacterium]NIX09870.1 DUF2069 domain-containing protein [Pseudomonadales bacterium]